MLLIIDGHDFHYEMENLCRVFFKEPVKTVTEEKSVTEQEACVLTSLKNTEGKMTVEVKIQGTSISKSKQISNADDGEREMAILLFKALSEYTGYVPPWGILTGVRPSKLMISLIEKYGEDGATRYYRENLLVSKEKADIAFYVAKAENDIIKASKENSFSLYVSIPFCPTRCSYCSFVSHSIENGKKLVEPYVELLCKEIEETGKIANKLGLSLETIYFGGGTPTALEAEQLKRVICSVNENFDLTNLKEYTIEAGRPDTVTSEKLDIIKKGNTTRISINPQTFNDDVLKEIGRKHTAAQAIEAYNMARAMGFDNINMDLIAGLPKDDENSFNRTLNIVTELNPENITVHTLALKRSSKIVTEALDTSDAEVTENMVRTSYKALKEGGYNPYYMYRQSQSIGNLENIGWCKKNYNCLYNVYMMEEIHTIISVGAGAVTKLKQPNGKYLERVFNYKYPYEYNTRHEEILKRKQRITEFYETYK